MGGPPWPTLKHNWKENMATKDKKPDTKSKKAKGKAGLEVITDKSENTDILSTPGPLRGASELILETRKGQMIFEGRRPDPDRKKAAIIGLKSFARYLRVIWDTTTNNDPYADWWLLKVEREIEAKEKWINDKYDEYSKILGQFDNLSHEVAHSISPIRCELRFSIPYSYRGAMLLMKYDELIKIIMTANHVALVESIRAHRDIEDSSKAARTVFHAVTGYRFTGVTRDDIYANNKIAEKASELMGPCPTGILDDEVVPKFESGKSMIMRKLRKKKSKYNNPATTA